MQEYSLNVINMSMEGFVITTFESHLKTQISPEQHKLMVLCGKQRSENMLANLIGRWSLTQNACNKNTSPFLAFIYGCAH